MPSAWARATAQAAPLLAVARKNGLVECLNPINGEALGITKIDQPLSLDGSLNDDHVVGLHLFKTKGIDVPPRSVSLLTCLEKGNACLRSIPVSDAPENSTTASHITWNVCSSGKIICSSVDKSENYALFGGKGIELNMWDLGKCSKIWSAKSPPSNRLGIFSPTWFTAATFLSEDDHRKVVAGTINHQSFDNFCNCGHEIEDTFESLKFDFMITVPDQTFLQILLAHLEC
ncbi:hypothetical protein C4D60_Mb06t12950 [Musa balbisiana]|uniref:Uncharacterized protein n=1 Tax=Musa balbisiana TaxID=52838 RepID=A0A4S8IQ47_MUSBA|nr:hypothetical protein C4D60_Mb06t12950 [Musa balbisiana]